MHLAMVSTAMLLALILFVSRGITQTEELVGQQLKLDGQWTEDRFKAARVRPWDIKEDPQRGRVAGQIDTVNADTRTLRIGPILVEWNEATEFEGLSVRDLAPGRVIKVSGQLAGPAHLIAKSIEDEFLPPNRLEMRGMVTEAEQRPDGSVCLTVLGVEVEAPRGAARAARSSGLTRRPDERRPEEQLTLTLFDRPLTIGGELRAETKYESNFALKDHAKDDESDLTQQLQLEFLYPLTEDTTLFLEGEASYEAELYNEGRARKPQQTIERGQTWLYMGNLLQSDFSLQIGRQSVSDKRSWWWDEDLDAVRLHYDQHRLYAELAVAQEIGNISTDPKQNDPETDHVLRLLGNMAWLWATEQRLDGFFLYQHDHSSRQSIGQLVKKDREDPSDATLLWLGARASGDLEPDRFGELKYWLDGAWVGGHEFLLDFKKDQERKDSLRVSSRLKRNVSGWGLDTGLSWETELPWRPTLTLSYAFGSGDRTPNRGTDRSFRQTGLHDNKVRFNGVNRFRYYGELLRPELSNLHIWTAALGFRFWQASSIEFLYHFYQQVHPAPFLRNARLKADPTGQRHPIGQEWDAVLGLHKWEHLEVECSAGLFRAGSAYGSLSGKTAYLTILEVTYNF